MAEGFDIDDKNVNRAMFTMLVSIYSELRATQMIMLTEIGKINDEENIKRVLDTIESFRELSHKEAYLHLKNKFGYFPDADDLISKI